MLPSCIATINIYNPTEYIQTKFSWQAKHVSLVPLLLPTIQLSRPGEATKEVPTKLIQA